FLQIREADGTAEAPAETVTATPAATETPEEPDAAETEPPEPEESPAAPPTTVPTAAPTGVAHGKSVYNERTYSLVSDMVYTYRVLEAKGADTVRTRLDELKAEDAGLGELWEGIMSCWDYARTELAINADELPDGLPEDDSLCIVVLGFQLMEDGTMAEELVGRCETALAAAQKYPNAFVAVTGGGTAKEEKTATEAGAMAAWLRAKGLPEERLIVEDTSLTTGQNAKNLCEILTQRYPQVKSLALVTSKYHMQMAYLLFTEAALLHDYEFGVLPYTVVSNAALMVDGEEEYNDTRRQAQYLWTLADPNY
ncbi:MAG: YdcF family protein, partial [Oscillospiraceae bacterium]|nr:YdcF family protein [Oscillospiraceae bacterium]